MLNTCPILELCIGSVCTRFDNGCRTRNTLQGVFTIYGHLTIKPEDRIRGVKLVAMARLQFTYICINIYCTLFLLVFITYNDCWPLMEVSRVPFITYSYTLCPAYVQSVPSYKCKSDITCIRVLPGYLYINECMLDLYIDIYIGFYLRVLLFCPNHIDVL